MFKVSVNRRLLVERRIQEDKNALVTALKNNDVDAAKKALTGISGDDIGLTSKDFRTLFNLINFGADSKGDENTRNAALDDARRLLGVGKNTSQTTNTQTKIKSLTSDESSVLFKFIGRNVGNVDELNSETKKDALAAIDAQIKYVVKGGSNWTNAHLVPGFLKNLRQLKDKLEG
jgi:hypothetical protein